MVSWRRGLLAWLEKSRGWCRFSAAVREQGRWLPQSARKTGLLMNPLCRISTTALVALMLASLVVPHARAVRIDMAAG